ncbi:MAG: DUF4011 domain-containing protein [Anaeroplasmataceae bacterium]
MKLKNVALNLLDLSKSNKLINFKNQKFLTVEVKSPDIDNLYQDILGDKKFEIYNIDKFVSMVNKEMDLNEIEYDDIYPHIEKNIRDKHIVLYKENGFVNPVIKNLKKKAYSSLQEQGVNILYLALGMLYYKENNIPFKAPIILVPIKIENTNANVYTISMYEEEALLNPCLSYKLKNELNINLKPYDDTMLPSEYLSYVSDSSKAYGWYTREECYISIFDFNKLNMYEDLIENEREVLKNPLITNLLNEKNNNTIIKNKYGDDLHLVLDADHSQIEAINAIRRGESIVLQGPPGTGKSQTITNLIASSLYDGKKILFVSEKQAALNVVYDKLKKLGLDEFALELHSNKTNKKKVIEELYKTLNTPKTIIDNEAYDILNEVSGIENILDDYAFLLHKKIDEYNKTPYEIFSNYSTYKNNCDYEITNINANYYNEVIKNIEKYTLYEDILEYDYRQFPFYGFKDLSKSHTKKNIEILTRNKLFLENVLSDISNIKKEFNVTIYNLDDYYNFYELYLTISNSKYVYKEFFNKDNIDKYISITTLLNNNALKVREIKEFISKFYKDDIYKDEYVCLREELLKHKGISRVFNSNYRKIQKKLKSIKVGKKVSYKNTIKALEYAYEFKKIDSRFELDAYSIRHILNDKYEGYNTSFSDILELLKKIKACSNIKDLTNFKYDSNNLELLSSINENIKGLDEYLSYQHLYDENIINLKTHSIKDLYLKTSNKITHYDYLPSWIKINDILNELRRLDALKFIDYGLDNKYQINELINVFKGVYYKSLTNKVLNDIEAFKQFNSIDMDKLVNIFIKRDHEHSKIARDLIKERLESMKPNNDIIAPGSPSSIINREYQKKRKQMSVRELINSNAEFIQTLKPAFLMSPLSVSTYLECGKVKFDLVIFDEASQIFPYDALGSIYRSNQMVVVGDPLQMPPSNFFNSCDTEDTEEESASDYESILDISLACLPKYSLMWHYRSKNEELIAYSNKHFYNNDLVTFPNALNKTEDFGVEEYYVENGVFTHKMRTNKEEALKVCELVREHYKKYKNKRSLGIVAFSISQQSLIESLVNDMIFKEGIDISNDSEPLFIKNLETVQGDERDTIIFSVGYGYDENHKFIQNFGPLNKEGGERRLNVAISRAKYNVKLVTSIKPTDITSEALGAKLLRGYIEFASNPATNDKEISSNSTDFSQDVKKFLEDSGYKVDYKVGYSLMKIDLCVKDPKTNNYIAAIECDGKSYFDLGLCRDRNRLRKEILERMGFKYIRVWSVGWYQNPKLEKTKLIEALNKENEDLVNMAPDDIVISYEKDDKTFEAYIYANDEELIKNYRGEEDFEDLIMNILNLEAPINESWLLKRILPIYKSDKVTRAIEDEYLLNKAMHLSKDVRSKDGYLFLSDKPLTLRIPDRGATPRDIKYISPYEIASGMKVIAINNENITKIELYKMCQRLMGYKRMTEAITKKYDEALDILKSTSIVIETDDKIKVVNI